MNSVSYSMTVTVTNVAPDFKTPPTYNSLPSPNNYQLHVMKSLQVSVPPLFDADGGQVVLNPSDTPGVGATGLNLAHDPNTNVLTITSTQIGDCGAMNPITF